MKEISNKWPAARLSGPDVSTENALEYIRRTDSCLINPEHKFNNRYFEDQLSYMIGNPYISGDLKDFQKSWAWQEKYSESFGHVELEHLGSSYVASSYIGGPNGTVSPSGKVSRANNFGKWPSVEEVEDDLNKIAESFPWLSFVFGFMGQC